jgi:nitrate reductase NapAB chaperone NapD
LIIIKAAKNEYSQIKGYLNSIESALQHSFNEEKGKLIRVCGAEKSSEKCQILTVWFG